jgi:hypothetical protein
VTHALIFERFSYQNSSLAALFAFREDLMIFTVGR